MKHSALILGVLFLFRCASVQTTTDMQPGDAEDHIRQMNQRFGTAVRAGNVDDVMSIYADEAVLLPPNTPALVGRGAIREFWQGFLGSSKATLDLVTDEVVQSCDMATEYGRYEMSMTPAGGGAVVRDSGKYMVVLRKFGDRWLVTHDMFNTSQPPPPAHAH